MKIRIAIFSVLPTFAAVWIIYSSDDKLALVLAGAALGAQVLALIDWHMESSHTQLYRRWYLMCREELERLDPHNSVLTYIGPRTKREN